MEFGDFAPPVRGEAKSGSPIPRSMSGDVPPKARWPAGLKAGAVSGALLLPPLLVLAWLHLLRILYGSVFPWTLFGAVSVLLVIAGLVAGFFSGGLAGLLLSALPERWIRRRAGAIPGLAAGAALTLLAGSRAWGPLPLAPYLLGGGAAWGLLAVRLRERWKERSGRVVFPVLMAAAAVLLFAAASALPWPGVEGPEGEFFGPSPVATATGDGGLAAGFTREGTLAILAWPGPGGNDQVAYRTTSPDLPRMGAQEEMGAFPLLRLSTPSGPVATRLDEPGWNSTPGYRAPDSPVVRTRSVHASLGLEVVQEDLVVPGRDVLLRRLQVSRLPGSPVSAALLEYHANFNPTTSRVDSFPVADWLLDKGLPEEVRCDASGVLHTTRGMGVAVAWAAEPPATYRCFTESDGRAVAGVPLDLSNGSANATVAFAVAADPEAARALLDGALRQPFEEHRARAEAEARAWLSKAPMPNTSDARILEVAQRSLLSIRTAADRQTGAIVASISRQPPYYVDWPRDGAFIGHALDRAGHPEMAEAHDLFYARVQRASGTWSMAYYTDGREGAPIPFEIDETGLALWTLEDHYRFTRNRTYLREVYPAMARGADFLAGWRDPWNGLPAPANEDDYVQFTQGLQGSVTVYAGLRAAAEAGRELGDDPARVLAWQRRADELRNATLQQFWNGRDFGGGHGAGSWFLWPAGMLPPNDSRAAAQAEEVWGSVESRMNRSVPWGMYEDKGPPALAYAWRDDSAKMERVRSIVRWLAHDAADPDTGHFGELRLLPPGGARWVNRVAMPHVWTHALFYISALDAFGERMSNLSRVPVQEPGFLDPLPR